MEERMGRKGTGVETRGKAIRIQFSLNGEVVRRTLRRDGMATPPSAENLSEAKRLAAEIRSRLVDLIGLMVALTGQRRLSSRHDVCGSCGSPRLVPLNSPAGQRIAKRQAPQQRRPAACGPSASWGG